MYAAMSASRGAAIRRRVPITPSYAPRTNLRGVGVYTTRKLGALDPATGYPIDSNTGSPYDPMSGQYVTMDPFTGTPAYVDTSGNFVDLAPFPGGNTAGVGVSTSITTSNNTAVYTGQSTGGNPLTAIFDTITGAVAAATGVMNAADLIKVNAQRASQGLPPLNQYGVVGPSSRTTSASLFASPLFLVAIVAGIFLLRK